MKLKMKVVAAAAALASLAGGAHADLTSGSTVNNGSFSLLAFNTVTFDWYIRDLGYLINDFLPSTITTQAGDGSVTGDKTPGAGIVIDGTVKSNFSDPSFATWLGTQTQADVRWMVGAYDQISNAAQQNQRRVVMSSKDANETFTNANLDSWVGTGNYGGLSSLFNPGGLSKTGTLINANALTGLQGGLTVDTMGSIGDSQNLFYAVRSAYTGSSSNSATITRFGNSENFASITLGADGELVYSLAAAGEVPPVPLPPALWMMGAGLAAIGGMVRRRRAAALEAA